MVSGQITRPYDLTIFDGQSFTTLQSPRIANGVEEKVFFCPFPEQTICVAVVDPEDKKTKTLVIQFSREGNTQYGKIHTNNPLYIDILQTRRETQLASGGQPDIWLPHEFYKHAVPVPMQLQQAQRLLEEQNELIKVMAAKLGEPVTPPVIPGTAPVKDQSVKAQPGKPAEPALVKRIVSPPAHQGANITGRVTTANARRG
jgi:hypothetical protein